MQGVLRSAFFLADRVFRSVGGSAAYMRLLDRVSQHEYPAPEAGADRRPTQLLPTEGRGAPHPGEATARGGPLGIRAWEVEWKAKASSPANGLGYRSLGGFHLPRQQAISPRPGILVLPILYDRFSLAAGTLARYFASQGFVALELRSGPPFLDKVRVAPKDSGPTWEDVVTEMILDGRRGLDWLSSRPEVDPGRLGIVGISHGAIIGPCVLGADSRPRAAVFCMGGADQALMVAHSREPSVRRFRRRFMRAHGLSHPLELLRFSDPHTSPTDPLYHAAAVDPRAVLLFKTRLDRAVVPEAQDKLWEALGRPRRITLPLGHIGFGLAFYYAARRATEFLRDRLSPPSS